MSEQSQEGPSTNKVIEQGDRLNEEPSLKKTSKQKKRPRQGKGDENDQNKSENYEGEAPKSPRRSERLAKKAKTALSSQEKLEAKKDLSSSSVPPVGMTHAEMAKQAAIKAAQTAQAAQAVRVAAARATLAALATQTVTVSLGAIRSLLEKVGSPTAALSTPQEARELVLKLIRDGFLSYAVARALQIRPHFSFSVIASDPHNGLTFSANELASNMQRPQDQEMWTKVCNTLGVSSLIAMVIPLGIHYNAIHFRSPSPQQAQAAQPQLLQQPAVKNLLMSQLLQQQAVKDLLTANQKQQEALLNLLTSMQGSSSSSSPPSLSSSLPPVGPGINADDPALLGSSASSNPPAQGGGGGGSVGPSILLSPLPRFTSTQSGGEGDRPPEIKPLLPLSGHTPGFFPPGNSSGGSFSASSSSSSSNFDSSATDLSGRDLSNNSTSSVGPAQPYGSSRTSS